MSKQRLPREKVSRKRDREVLDAAARVFHAQGFSNASMQQVADELGILKGSLYYYTKSKDELLLRLLDETHADLCALTDEIAASELNARDKLHAFVSRSIQYNIDNLARISVYYNDVARLDKEHRRKIYADQREQERFVVDLVEELRPGDEQNARVLAMCIFSTIIWTYRWYRPGRFPSKTLAKVCADFVLRGIIGN